MTRLSRQLEPIQALAAAYRRGDESPVRVTADLLGRIERDNPALNAFISVWHDAALESADAAERELRAGRDRGPLHGVPVALKDNIEVEGSSATYGSHAVPRPRPGGDAWITTTLRRAGAVILGKTNLLEYAYGIAHPDYGKTNNPWDTGRTAGGSSGGSAAAVGAGMCYAAIGSDTGGSIRIPAAYCGVAGIKPTYGRLPLDGVFPLSWSLDHVGPIAQTAEDLALVWSVLADDGMPQPPPAASLRLGVLGRYLGSADMEPDVDRATEAMLARFAAAGATVDRVDSELLAECDEHLINLVLPEASLAHDAFLRGQEELYAPGTRDQLEHGYGISAVAWLKGRRYQQQLAAALDELLADRDALLVPSAPWIAPAEDPPIGSDAGDAEGRRTAPFNLSGHPAVTFSLGLVRGCPIGLQVITRHGQDAMAIAVARTLESIAGPTIPTEPLELT